MKFFNTENYKKRRKDEKKTFDFFKLQEKENDKTPRLRLLEDEEPESYESAKSLNKEE
jgi:hypothetical protein